MKLADQVCSLELAQKLRMNKVIKELDKIETLICRFCVSCRSDGKDMPHKEFLNYWHDQFAIEGYAALNIIYSIILENKNG